MGIVAAVFSFVGVNELLLLFAAGLLMAATRRVTLKRSRRDSMGIAAFLAPPATANAAVSAGLAAGAATAATLAFGLWPMFLFFLKVGSVLTACQPIIHARRDAGNPACCLAA